MEELNAEEIWHEAGVRIKVKDLRNEFRGGDGVGHRILEGGGGGPEVGVFEEADRVPFRADEDAEYTDDMAGIGRGRFEDVCRFGVYVRGGRMRKRWGDCCGP